jgi:spore germination protein GerM
VTDPVDPSTDDGSSTEAPVSNPPSTITLRLYWVSAGENALGVERTVPYTRAVATVAMTELLAGPTAAEKTIWPAIDTAIPAGTKLLGVTVANRVAKVDLSGEFASGGGTFSVTARLAQVVYTLTQFPTVDAVEFYLNGARVDVFSSEGLILDGPQRLEDYDALLPIDA